jgi:EAL domain-containing protein (putative c-di-GMP-specific phosphodiesterase class I)/GGDEF domain-containing protein
MRYGPTDAPIFQARAIGFLALSFAFGAGASTSLIAVEFSTLFSVALLAASVACGRYWVTRAHSSDGTNKSSDLNGGTSEVEHPRSSNIHPITKLATREMLFDTIAATQDPSGTLTLIRLADYDGLAAFDEQKAHKALISFSRRLASSIGPDRVLTQVDRDSFALWFPDGADREQSRNEIRAITYVARQELVDIDHMVPAIEIGLAYCPEDGNSGGELLKRAVGVKSAPEISSTGELSLPSRLPPEVEREIFVIEKALPFAIEGKQLTLAFQPLVDLSEHKVVGAEALLRWKHPELGNVSPGQFIPIMERIGLSDMIGMWVLNAACREARHWRETGFGDLRVAINLSARQLLDPALLSKVERTLARHGLDGSAIELELTETAAMADINYSRQIFSGLRDMGVTLAIDDFGSGYSSMSYLQNLPFDKLKIDRAFVTDIHARPQSRAICEAIMVLGSGLNLKVLCEGVETQEELAVLHRLGCRLFQGYFFAKPMTADAFRTFVKSPFDLNWQQSPVAAQMAQISKRFSA